MFFFKLPAIVNQRPRDQKKIQSKKKNKNNNQND